MDQPATRDAGERNNTVQDDNRAVDNTAVDNTAVDNTAVNVRDRDELAQTPLTQGQSPQDVLITAEIRRAVLGAEGLSTYADNVKIVSNEGVVTLRGPVATAEEKALIEAKAKAVTGVVRVDNQLEVPSF